MNHRLANDFYPAAAGPSAPWAADATPAFVTFDDATFDAVLRFQKANQLMVDGIVGPQTWSALGVVVEQVLRPQDILTVTPYRAVIRVPLKKFSRTYYVNGIQTECATDAHTAWVAKDLRVGVSEEPEFVYPTIHR